MQTVLNLDTKPLLPGDPCTPEQAMQLAVSVAQKGAGWVAPNPLVGCVVVSKDGKLLASGYHERCGQAHAEVNALDKIEPHLRAGTTVYVTLEPCSHQGRTPPCADRLIKDKVYKVVVGVRDPNPLVSGRGIRKLQQAGIEVAFDSEFGRKSQRVAEHFLWNMTHKKPFVTLKLAMSLDGQVALASGDSQWITSVTSRSYARQLRAHHDATLIGAQTFLHDHPRLDFRETDFEIEKKNRIYIWDPKDKTNDVLPQSQLQQIHGADRIHIVKDISDRLLEDIYAQGVTSLYVEGGAQTLSQFIEKRLFNKLVVFVAPILLGQGKSWTSGFQISDMKDKLSLEFNEVKTIDGDVVMTAVPVEQN